jgi:hypothetical protein
MVLVRLRTARQRPAMATRDISKSRRPRPLRSQSPVRRRRGLLPALPTTPYPPSLTRGTTLGGRVVVVVVEVVVVEAEVVVVEVVVTA